MKRRSLPTIAFILLGFSILLFLTKSQWLPLIGGLGKPSPVPDVQTAPALAPDTASSKQQPVIEEDEADIPNFLPKIADGETDPAVGYDEPHADTPLVHSLDNSFYVSDFIQDIYSSALCVDGKMHKLTRAPVTPRMTKHHAIRYDADAKESLPPACILLTTERAATLKLDYVAKIVPNCANADTNPWTCMENIWENCGSKEGEILRRDLASMACLRAQLSPDLQLISALYKDKSDCYGTQAFIFKEKYLSIDEQHFAWRKDSKQSPQEEKCWWQGVTDAMTIFQKDASPFQMVIIYSLGDRLFGISRNAFNDTAYSLYELNDGALTEFATVFE